MPSFNTLIQQLSEDNYKKGRQFERICKWLLENAPQYALNVGQVWLWDEWPDADGPDRGIDLVARTTDDKLWAIQAKAWDKETNVTKHDMDSFIAESEGSRFALRLLITTSKGVARAVQTLENRGELHPPLRRMCRHDLEDREWPASFSDLKQGWKVPRPPGNAPTTSARGIERSFRWA